MSVKKFIKDFYKSDALINGQLLATYLHDDIEFVWTSSTGKKTYTKSDLVALATEMSRAYVRSKVCIKSLVKEKNHVAVFYAHYVKTIENPREDILLADFAVVWEVKDEKLVSGTQISQLV